MDEATLPERLRFLSTRFAQREHVEQVGDALRGAADELERLTRPPAPPGDLIDPSDVIYALRYGLETPDYVGTEHDRTMRREALRLLSTATLARLEREAHPLHVIGGGRPLVDALEVLEALEAHGERHAPAGTDRGARGGTHAGGLRAAAAIVRELAALDGDVPLHELGAELAGDAGVASPMPQTRAFVAYYREGEALPAPGSFVFVGPALAVWRVHRAARAPEPPPGEVLAVHRDADGTDRLPVFLELEAVDAHDVPVATRRVGEVPLPVHEVDADGQAIA